MKGKYDSASSRWAAVGPYYAMFPTAFADDVVARFTDPGDWVLDPFAGRGTSVFSAAIAGRHGVGVEVNPVGWLYGATKLAVADESAVVARLRELESIADDQSDEGRALPTFFRRCFTQRVLAFLIAARRELNWRHGKIDRTLMAFVLVYLHGKRDAALSNQMRQTKSMAPAYAVRWWHEHGSKPPTIDPGDFLRKRIKWRYARGLPAVSKSYMFLGDCTSHVRSLGSAWAAENVQPARLLLTSPPYYQLTNYHYDQWLRLWMLGGRPDASRTGGKHQGKFESRTAYRDLLCAGFQRSARFIAPDAVVYVRTGRRQFTYETTIAVLSEVFPHHAIREVDRPYTRPTQTHLFGDQASKTGEVDLVLTRE